MFPATDLPDTIPLFPLPGALLLPRGRLPLHIFEPRYLAMLDDVLKTPARLIGMIQPLDDGLHNVGCVGRITGFNEAGDGRYMISLTGISRFRVSEQVTGFTPYIRAEVSWQGFERDLGAEEHDEGFDKVGFLALLERFFDAEELDTDWDSLKGAAAELLINSLSMLAPFSSKDKQALLEAQTLAARRETLITLIEFALRRGGAGDEVMQ